VNDRRALPDVENITVDHQVELDESCSYPCKYGRIVDMSRCLTMIVMACFLSWESLAKLSVMHMTLTDLAFGPGYRVPQIIRNVPFLC
jgi:hypothetical protein